jgi:hypothetical protein
MNEKRDDDEKNKKKKKKSGKVDGEMMERDVLC